MERMQPQMYSIYFWNLKLKIRRTPDMGLKHKANIQNGLVVALSWKNGVVMCFCNWIKYFGASPSSGKKSMFDHLKKKVKIKSGISQKPKHEPAQEKKIPSH